MKGTTIHQQLLGDLHQMLRQKRREWALKDQEMIARMMEQKEVQQ